LLEKICIHITHGYLSKMSFRILLSTAKMQIGTKYIKETLNAFTPTRVLLFFLFFECILSGRGIQNDRGEAGEREQRRFRTKMDKSRGKKWLAVTVTHLKNGWANGIVKEDSSIPFQISWRRFVGRFIYPQ